MPKIGMLLVTHGRLGEEMISALEHVVGPQTNAEAIAIDPENDMERCRRQILESIKRVDGGGGVVLLTDMFGGTPSNLAISVMNETGVEVLAGVNLPMLIGLARARGKGTLADAVTKAKDAGRKYINVVSELLADREE